VSGPLSYEPSVEAIVAELLPSSCLLAGAAGLRRRVAWTVLARSTGLGELEGGELVLAPDGRGREIVARLGELATAGVVGVVVGSGETLPDREVASTPVALIRAAPDTDMRRLQADVERFIARRRRELFSLEKRLHQVLTEAAIGGAEVEELLREAAGLTSREAVLDRDGDLLVQPPDCPPPSVEALVRTRMAVHGAAGHAVRVEGPPTILAAPVVAGSERRGIVMLLGTGTSTLDADEAVLASLASACAIALARTPDEPTPSLEKVVRAFDARPGTASPPPWDRIIALAVEDVASSPRQLDRALRAELTVRGLEHVLGSSGQTLIALTVGGSDLAWDHVVRAISLRLGSAELRAGLGRQYESVAEAGRSCWEAQEALRRSVPGGLTRFPEIELVTLLRSSSHWTEFARGRLGPLLDGSTASADLLDTLRAYLQAGQNAKEAARTLHVHRNTLLYRLRRIRALLGVDLEEADAMFELDLSLRVLEAGSSSWRSATEQ
jgi:hypothetical protein